MSTRIAFVLLALSAVPCAADDPPPRRPNFEPPPFFVALRVPPSTASRAAAFTIPVEIAELHPRDEAQAGEVQFLMPATASPSDVPALRWDFAQGLGQLLRPESPVPCRAFALRPHRMALPTVRSVIAAAAPRVRRDPQFARQLATMGLAAFALKEGETLASVFPGIPLDKGAGKLGNALTQVHYACAFAGNVQADAPYAFHAVDATFKRMLDVLGYSPSPATGDGLTAAAARVADVLNHGAGANADDRNNKRRIFEIKLDFGQVPRGDAKLDDVTADIGADPKKPAAYAYRLWPFAGGDGVVDFGGFVQPKAGSRDQEINVSLLATTDPAELRGEILYLTLKAWRARTLLDPASHQAAAERYTRAQALMRMNEPLWEYLCARRVLQHVGPRVKVFGDELVPQMDPVSARIWEDRKIRDEAFVNAPASALETFEEYPAGQDLDGFFPLRADSLQYEMDRAVLIALQTKDALKLEKKLTGELVALLARGYHRPWRTLPLAGTLAAAQPGRGAYTAADPELEPDLAWLARATSAAADGAKDASALVYPFAAIAKSPLALGVQALVGANVVAVEYTAPAKLPEGSHFRFLYQPKEMAPLLAALTFAKTACKPAQDSARVRTSATGKAQGWSQAWFDDFKTSEGKTPPTSQADLDTWQYCRLTSALEAAIHDGGMSGRVDPQYVVVKPAAKLADGLVYAGRGTETAASSAVRAAVGINLELIERLHPVGDDPVVDAATQRALMQKAYLEQSVLTVLKPADELLTDFWTASLIDWVPHNELWFRTMGHALGAAIGGSVRVHHADRTSEEL